MSAYNKKGYHSLSKRIVTQFCLFTLVLSVLYGFITFVMMYNLEDGFIERVVQQEAQYLRKSYQQNGEWSLPRKSTMTLHFNRSTFPDDIRDTALAEPNRSEFYGDEGRHYHLYTFDEYHDIFLLAEVGNELMIRPVRNDMVQFLLVCAGILTLISCAVAWTISRKMTRPLTQLADLVGGVDPQHIPSKFTQAYPNNEIGVLSSTLEHTFARINQVLLRETAFTRDVSHELRSPLAIIKNAAELYRTVDVSLSESKVIAKRIEDAAERMDKTVNTLLALAREENTQSEQTSISLIEIAERAVIDNHQLLEGKCVDVHIDDSCNCEVVVREGMLKILLDNLLSNAFQYTQHGDVLVTYERGCVIVKDTGPGIQPNISENVTEPSVKGAQSTGFGFGLSIVKRLCEHQGWALSIQSDKGTQVSVLL